MFFLTSQVFSGLALVDVSSNIYDMTGIDIALIVSDSDDLTSLETSIKDHIAAAGGIITIIDDSIVNTTDFTGQNIVIETNTKPKVYTLITN